MLSAWKLLVAPKLRDWRMITEVFRGHLTYIRQLGKEHRSTIACVEIPPVDRQRVLIGSDGEAVTHSRQWSRFIETVRTFPRGRKQPDSLVLLHGKWLGDSQDGSGDVAITKTWRCEHPTDYPGHVWDV